METTESITQQSSTEKLKTQAIKADSTIEAKENITSTIYNDNYNVQIPRKIVEAICNTSTGTLNKLEKEGIIQSEKVKQGGLDIVTYGVKDVQAIFKYKKVSFKQKEEAEVIAIFNQKGGVGKSAFTQHLGSVMSLVGRVLIVDLDAQSDATLLFGLNNNYGDLVLDDEELDPTIAELIDWSLEDGSEPPYNKIDFKDAVKNISPSLDIIPADLDLGEINYSLNRLPLKPRIDSNGRQIPAELLLIKEVLDDIKNQYDYIIIDCPPNIETCNVSALFSCNRILIPLELEAKTLTTMKRNIEFLNKLNSFHPGFTWDKILVVPNKFRREIIKIKALAALQDTVGEDSHFSLSEVVIPNATLIDKCSDARSPIFAETSRFSGKTGVAASQAKEFTDYFWAIMHEILNLPLERLVFNNPESKGK